jgi:sporulation protein YlmC with PRC-barrel domain
MLLGGVAAAMLGTAPFVALADDATPANVGAVQVADTAVGEVDAGKLVGQDVYDANGDKVGDIESVMVDQGGKVNAVVLDVSGWLESEKLIAVKWTDLKMGADGKIVSPLTKDAAKAAAAYQFKDEGLRGQVMTESGERYAAATAPAATTTADATAGNSAIVNADGTLNASKLIGLDVQSPEDNKVGDIGEVVLDKAGEVQGVVVDVGGFLGIATHPVLLEWKDVTLTSQDGKDRAVVGLNKEKLEQMPTYQSSSK